MNKKFIDLQKNLKKEFPKFPCIKTVIIGDTSTQLLVQAVKGYGFELKINLLERVVGTKDKLLVEPIKKDEILMLNVNAAATVGVVKELSKETIKCTLKRPVCAEKDSRVTISRRFGNRWRLIGFGTIS